MRREAKVKKHTELMAATLVALVDIHMSMFPEFHSKGGSLSDHTELSREFLLSFRTILRASAMTLEENECSHILLSPGVVEAKYALARAALDDIMGVRDPKTDLAPAWLAKYLEGGETGE